MSCAERRPPNHADDHGRCAQQRVNERRSATTEQYRRKHGCRTEVGELPATATPQHQVADGSEAQYPHEDQVRSESAVAYEERIRPAKMTREMARSDPDTRSDPRCDLRVECLSRYGLDDTEQGNETAQGEVKY